MIAVARSFFTPLLYRECFPFSQETVPDIVALMCLTVPRKVEKIEGKTARLQDGRTVRLDLVPEVNEGDFVLAQADLAIEKITPAQVAEMKKVMGEEDTIKEE